MDRILNKLRIFAITSRINSLNNKSFVVIVLILVFMSFVLISYLCPAGVCAINLWSTDPYYRRRYINSLNKERLDQSLSESSYSNHFRVSFDDIIDSKESVFDIKGNDVIVFLHIQKTGQYLIIVFKLMSNQWNRCPKRRNSFWAAFGSRPGLRKAVSLQKRPKEV